MKNQINIEDQNTQQIGQNPINQPSVNSVPEKPRVNLRIFLTVLFVLLISLLLVAGSVKLYFSRQNTTLISNENKENYSNSINPKWLTYTNRLYKFTLNYPSDWYLIPYRVGSKSINTSLINQLVTNPDDPLSELKPDAIWFTMDVYRVGNNPLEDPNIQLFSKKVGEQILPMANVTITKLADLKIDGYPTVKFANEPSTGYTSELKRYGVEYVFQKDSNIYSLSFLTFSKEVANNNSDTIDKIATSWHFTNINLRPISAVLQDNPNLWKEMTDSKLSLSFKYPEEVTYYPYLNLLEMPIDYYSQQDRKEEVLRIELYPPTNIGNMTLEQYCLKELEKNHELSKASKGQMFEISTDDKISEFTIGDQKGCGYNTTSQLTTTNIYTIHGMWIIKVSKSYEDPDNKGYNELANKILSTFKFSGIK